MSGWTNVDLTKVSPQIPKDIIPEGDYTFVFRGAKWSERFEGRIDASAQIGPEQTNAGQFVSFGFPNPDEKAWSAHTFKRLEQSFGVDIMEGEDPVAYLNRNIGAKFRTRIKNSKYTPKDSDGNAVGEEQTRSNVDTFKFSPAA